MLYAATGDRVWWTWDGEAVANVKETLLILEEDKVLNPVSRRPDEGEDESRFYFCYIHVLYICGSVSLMLCQLESEWSVQDGNTFCRGMNGDKWMH